MLIFAFIVEILFAISFPIALGWWIQRRWQTSWKLFLVGAATFIASQVVHIPLNLGLTAAFNAGWLPRPPASWRVLFNSFLLGLTAGLCEEPARYIAYRWVLRRVRTWREALMFGAGHGGVEAILLVGVLVPLTFMSMVFLRGMDIDALGLPPEQAALVQEQVDAYWGQPWYNPLLGAVERLFAIIFHLGMAVLVLQAVVRERLHYLLIAIVLHTLTNAVAVFTMQSGWNLFAVEGLVGLFALLGLGIILYYRPQTAPTLFANQGEGQHRD